MKSRSVNKKTYARRKMRRLTLVIILILAALTAAAVGRIYLKKNDSDSKTGKNPLSVAANEKKQICRDIDYNAEIINMQQTDKYLKLDYIMPGLDTYELKTVIYSLVDDRVVSKMDFGEGEFTTGILNDGFFVINNRKKEINIFDCKCNLLKTAYIPCDNQMALAYLSRDGQYVCFADAFSAEIYICNIEGQNKKKICDFTSFIDMKDTTDHTFYLKMQYDDLLIIDAEKQTSNTQTLRGYIELYSSDYCVEKTDTDFNLIRVGKEQKITVPLSVIDELPSDVSDSMLITVSGETDGDVLNIYNLENKTVFSVGFSERISGAKDLNNGLIAVIGAKEIVQKPNVYLISAENKKSAKNYNKEPEKPKQKTENTVSSEDINKAKTKLISGVGIISQYPEYPTGCESVSAVMAMRYCGADITVGDFVDNYLEKNGNFYYENDKKYGPDPYEYFIGSPRSLSAFGCMAPVIEKALKKYYHDGSVVNTTGETLSSLCSKYIDKDVPVLVWVSIDMLEPYYKNSWFLQDGSEFKWPSNEHCMLLVGYDDAHYFFNDPYRGALVKYSKELSDRRYKQYGSQSVLINRTK